MTITAEYNPETFDWWRDELAGRSPPWFAGDANDPDVGGPMSGFFRGKRSLNNPLASPDALYFWYLPDRGEKTIHDRIMCYVNVPAGLLPGEQDNSGREYKHDATELFQRVCRQAVSRADYDYRCQHGRWRDEPDTGPTDKSLSPFEALKARIAVLSAQAAAMTVADDEAATAAVTLRGALQGCKSAAVSGLEDESAPFKAHYERFCTLKKNWDALAKAATEVAKDVLKPKIERYEGEKLRRRQAEVAAANARIVADAQVAATAERARQAAEAGVSDPALLPGSNQPPVAVAVPQIAAPMPESQIKGAVGRAAHVGVKWEIDWDKGFDVDELFRYFRDNDRLIACLKDLAERKVKDGFEVPGVTRQQGVKIR